MTKIRMKHDNKIRKVTLPDGYSSVQLTEKNYKEHTKFLSKYFKNWKLWKTVEESYLFVPKCWYGIRKNGVLVGVCSASFGVVKKEEDRHKMAKKFPKSNIEITNAAKIESLAVSDRHRGEGLGAYLLSKVISTLYKYGYRNVYVLVAKKNKVARSVYENAGFVRI